jgi:RimJ/RimL family protein N-acetyltransferase
MLRIYKCLSQQEFKSGNYKLAPIREEDKYEIMRWRNEQLYHLRQQKPLSENEQEKYFSIVISPLFEQEQPAQVLFSYLENETCIGYGGLVHINWKDRYAEISFIINTALEKDLFQFHWTTYLSLIEQAAFEGLKLHKIFTYAYDLRPHLYKAVEAAGFQTRSETKRTLFF